MFYRFAQNNSGGRYIITDGLSQEVYIEADSADEANSIAVDIGIYFDGVEAGTDCECCGDRWYRVSEYDRMETVTLKYAYVIHYKKQIVTDSMG